MKKSILFTTMLLSLYFATLAFAVMFADDKLFLYEGGGEIKDNSVIIYYEVNDEYEVCFEGIIWTRQGPGSLSFTFYKTNDPHLITEIKEWWHTEKGKDDLSGEKYQNYLREKADKAEYKITVILPEPSREMSYTPPKGRTGGIIGDTRYLKVDLLSGKIEGMTKKRGSIKINEGVN
ncbi:MAG: hypothetical protein U9R21_02675 [Candidatus Thermoplasmatota archaeon]|nr:hypothetical protein [Candidatus Thermoplasmatota archaeon]